MEWWQPNRGGRSKGFNYNNSKKFAIKVAVCCVNVYERYEKMTMARSCSNFI